MDKVRIGIIGIGNIGSAHAKSIASGKVRNLELTAVCDIDSKKRELAGAIAPTATFFSSYEDLLDSGLVDAVIISVPHYIHPVISIKAFEKGLHVLTEKPAGVYTKQVLEMNQAAKKSGKVFGIMFNQRTNPLFRKAREMVRSGRLGHTKRLVWIITNWYRTQAYYDSGSWRATWAGEGGGVLLNQAPHNLDLWQWIFGMPSRVRGFCTVGKYHSIEVEDDATIYAEYENGATAMFITSTGEYPGTNRLEISGERGKIVIEDGRLRFWELGVSEREYCYGKNDVEITTTYHEIVPEEVETAHTGILQNFTDAIINGTELLSPGYEGLNELSISNAAYLSAWTDEWVNLPIDQDEYLKQLKKRALASREKKLVSKDNLTVGQYHDRWSINW
ncbi:MAG: Gfo/Idh/MocA family oxidoreductase [Oscillospiraceae bacterium]|nr:Gfo/Idh/MocA family oxidoreductase [Oscillospiraceae bacterium]